MLDLANGLDQYRSSSIKPINQKNQARPVIWQEGSTQVIDYASAECNSAKPIVLFIPSLINKAYILDLKPDRSLLKYIANQGFHPLLLDWNEPGEKELEFDLSDYVLRVTKAIQYIKNKYNKKVILAGYCMGGVIALAAAQLSQNKIKGLALLATPWDFHSKDSSVIRLDKKARESLTNLINNSPTLSKEFIHAMFYANQPFSVHQKFREFGYLNQVNKKSEAKKAEARKAETRKAEDFVYIENWVNDGVPLVKKVAHECLIQWGQKNKLMQGNWQIGDKKISPVKIKMPVFAAIANKDKIVPPGCSQALVENLKNKTIVKLNQGHVGMVVSDKARKSLWGKMTAWLDNIYNEIYNEEK